VGGSKNMPLFGDSKRIYKKEFNKILKKTPDISRKDRKYLGEVFSKDMAGGLTRFEVNQRTKQLRHNTKDILKPYEVKRVKNRLSNVIRGIDKPKK